MSDSTILRAIASPFHFLHFPKYIPSHDILRRGNAAILGNQLLVRHIDLVKEPLWSIITLRKSWLNYHTQASCLTLLRFISLKSFLKLSIFRGQEQNLAQRGRRVYGKGEKMFWSQRSLSRSEKMVPGKGYCRQLCLLQAIIALVWRWELRCWLWGRGLLYVQSELREKSWRRVSETLNHSEADIPWNIVLEEGVPSNTQIVRWTEFPSVEKEGEFDVYWPAGRTATKFRSKLLAGMDGEGGRSFESSNQKR